MNFDLLAKTVRSLNDNDILFIDKNGVCLKDARIYGMEYQKEFIKIQRMILNTVEYNVETNKYYFFVDGTMFYSYNDDFRRADSDV